MMGTQQGSGDMHGINEHTVLQALSYHIGAENGVCCRNLVVEITHKADNPAACRRLRKVIEMLRHEGSHICGHPSAGYYLAANDEDVSATCEFLYARAMTSLHQICRMKNISMPDIRGQLRLKL